MICEHLRPLEEAIVKAGIGENYRGKPWGDHCREWVYFNCFINTEAVASNFPLAACVKIHAHRGTHDGSERGFVCSQCHDGVIGSYEPLAGVPAFEADPRR